MKSIFDWLKNAIEINPGFQTKMIVTLIIIFSLWLLRRIILKIVYSRKAESAVLYQWRKTTVYIASFIGLFAVLRVWFEGIESLTTIIGLISAGIAIALKDMITSFVGWIFIVWRKPLTVGDRVQIGANAGDVIDIRIFQFSLMEIGNWVDAEQSTGRVIHVPNSRIFTEVLANYSQGFQYIWNEIPILMTFESNWEKAEKLLNKIAVEHSEHLSDSAERKVREASKKYMIFYSALTPKIYVSVKDCGVMLTIRYLTVPRKRRSSEEDIWKEVLREFAKCDDIDFAYPTQRFYNNLTEGKPGTGPRQT